MKRHALYRHAMRTRVTRSEPVRRADAVSPLASSRRVQGPSRDATNAALLHAPETDRVPEIVRDVLNSPGRAVGAATRAFFEPRFGHDFSRVRIHDDAQARASARAVDAQAYTVGDHVTFARAASRPESEDDRRLMAHEFAHVVQQRRTASGSGSLLADRIALPRGPSEVEASDAANRVLRGTRPSLVRAGAPGALHRARKRAKPAPTTVFYQEAIDMLAVERRPESVRELEALVALCDAMDRGSRSETGEMLTSFLGSKNGPRATLSSELLAQMVSRLMLLDMGGESERLKRWGMARLRTASKESDRGFGTELHLWKRIEELLLDRIPTRGGAEGLAALDALLTFFDQVLQEEFSLSGDAIAQDRSRRADEIADHARGKPGEPLGLFGGGPHREPTIALYADALDEIVHSTFIGIQRAFQVVLDQAVEDLAAGRGDAMVRDARDRLDHRLQPLVAPLDRSRQVGGVAVEMTRSEFRKGGGTHYDALDGPGAPARSIDVSFYDPKDLPEDASEMSSDFGGVLLARQSQLALIEALYGLEKNAEGRPTEETALNAKAISQLGAGGLRLHSDDDWRRFVVQQFEVREQEVGPEAALIDVTSLLQQYLRVFTVHTPYNIKDDGDNYLTRTFPRDLAGRLIHDCGVYALRVAYILSLLRDHPKLKLHFRYVVMPYHVGLVITGANLPMFLVNNDEINRISTAEASAFREKWNQLNEAGEPGPPARAATEARFVGELTVHDYRPGFALPYKPVDVRNSVSSPKELKKMLWSQYKSKVARNRLFEASIDEAESPNYQFPLRYLTLMERDNAHFTKSVQAFWDVEAPHLWDTHRTRVIKSFRTLESAKTLREQNRRRLAHLAAVKPYRDALEAAMRRVIDASPIPQELISLEEHIAKHQTLSRDTEFASVRRIEAMAASLGIRLVQWQHLIDDHLRRLEEGTGLYPPFALPQKY